LDEIWTGVKKGLHDEVGAHDYQMWIQRLRTVGETEGELVLGCPNDLARQWVEDRFQTLIAMRVSEAAGRPVPVALKTAPEEEGPGDKVSQPPIRQLSLGMDSTPAGGGRFLRRDFTFDRFVVGEFNAFAYSAAMAMVNGARGVNQPLCLLSKNGNGKSHLSQAMGHEIKRLRPLDRVFYVTVEDFAQEMVSSLHRGTISEFKEKYRRNCDVLLMEDLQYLTGKERTQVELAFALDHLLEAGKKLIFTSVYTPAKIPKLHESLFSRLSASVVTAMEAPDFATRVRILKKKAADLGLPLAREILEFLASELTESVRQLEAGLNGVAAKSSLLQVPMDLCLAEGVVKTIVRQKSDITLGVLKRLVCQYYHITNEEIIGKGREQRVVKPRQVAMYLGKRYTDQSIQSIGRSFNRYHATALHSIAVVERLIRERGELQRQVEFLCEKVEAGEF